jgi:hypothetical protein
MKSSVVQQYHSLSRRKKFVSRALAILGALILLIAALTFYGSQTGNFVVSVKNVNRNESIALSIDEERNELVSRLVVNPLKDCIDACYDDIPSDIEDGLGTKNDGDYARYLALSFYLVNNGTTARNFTMDFRITSVTKNVDDIIRVMVIQDGERTFYSKARENDTSGYGEPIWGYRQDGIVEIQEAKAFEDESTILFKEFQDFEVNDYMKFTIVIWLDGFDEQNPDGNTEMLGGALKTELLFSISG